jgi:hypothetical protein
MKSIFALSRHASVPPPGNNQLLHSMKPLLPIFLISAVLPLLQPLSAAPEKPAKSADTKPGDQGVKSLKAQLTSIRATLQKEHEMTRHDMARGYLYPRKVAKQVNSIKTDGLPADLVTAITALKEASARECAHIKDMPADDDGAVNWMTDMQGDAKFMEKEAKLREALEHAETALAKVGKVHGLGNECYILREDDDLPGVSAEAFGQLELGLSAADTLKIIGKPASKDEDVLMEATGMRSQTWSYPALGLTVNMESTVKGGEQSIGSLRAVPPCNMATARGIKIGSTEAEVKKAYAKEKEKETSADGKSFTAGSIYGGVMFEIEKGKVSQIFIGAGAE